MQLQNLLTTVSEPASIECWDDGSTPSALEWSAHCLNAMLPRAGPVREVDAVFSAAMFKGYANHSRALGVRLHSAGLSLRETVAVLEVFGVHRSHQAIWQWVP